ncbi:MAG: hypothetical protein JW759_05950 [Candidatus Coatesbacteria bacterium]|nr:hypothetical protein [Candidatus Coatesbacteria bacterium]
MRWRPACGLGSALMLLFLASSAGVAGESPLVHPAFISSHVTGPHPMPIATAHLPVLSPVLPCISALPQGRESAFLYMYVPDNKLYFHVANPKQQKKLAVTLPVRITSSHPQQLLIRGKEPQTDVNSLTIASPVERRGRLLESEKGTQLKIRWYAKIQPEFSDWTVGQPRDIIRQGTVFEAVSWTLDSSLPGEAKCEIKCELLPDSYQIDGHYSSGEIVVDFVPIL